MIQWDINKSVSSEYVVMYYTLYFGVVLQTIHAGSSVSDGCILERLLHTIIPAIYDYTVPKSGHCSILIAAVHIALPTCLDGKPERDVFSKQIHVI